MSISRDFKVNKFGRNPDLDGAGEDVWDATGAYEFPLVAHTTEILGGGNDDVGSSGVHSVVINGLNINGIPISEVATLTGATPVTLANSYYRVNRAYITKTGSMEVNSWDITVRHVGSMDLGVILAGEGQTQQAIYTMPSQTSGAFLLWYADVMREGLKTDAAASIRLQTRVSSQPWRTQQSANINDGSPLTRRFDVSCGGAIPVSAGTDIRVRVTAVNTDNLGLTSGFVIVGRTYLAR